MGKSRISIIVKTKNYAVQDTNESIYRKWEIFTTFKHYSDWHYSFF